jgi:hypothetical protein
VAPILFLIYKKSIEGWATLKMLVACGSLSHEGYALLNVSKMMVEVSLGNTVTSLMSI